MSTYKCEKLYFPSEISGKSGGYKKLEEKNTAAVNSRQMWSKQERE